MINFEALDQFYDAHVEATGFPPLDGIFNKQALYPMAQLPAMVECETREMLQPSRIPALISAGWLEPLPLSYKAESDEGFPAYIPGRIGLFLNLEKNGYDAAELRAIVAYEEHLVDDILTTDELAYVADDRELLIRHFEGCLAADTDFAELYGNHPSRSALDTEARDRELANIKERRGTLERDLNFVRAANWESLPDRRRKVLGRFAFRVRQAEEFSRLIMFDENRSKVEQGYSPCIHFRQWSGLVGSDFTFEGVIWSASLYDAWVPEGDDYLPLRVPGLQLDGDRIIPTRMLIPSEYERLWNKYDLDEYAQVIAKMRGESICQHCNKMLPTSSDPRRRYCDSRCRDAARSKRFRERNPQKTRHWNRRYQQDS